MAKPRKGQIAITEYGEALVLSVAKGGNVLLKYFKGKFKGREARLPSGLISKVRDRTDDDDIG